jgi:hypothetical protein
LVQNYREWSNVASNSDGSLVASNFNGSPTISAFCAVQQLYVNLHKLNLNFGVISSLDLTYLVKRDGLELSISEPIKWDSDNLIAALGFLIHLAAQAQATTSHVGKRTFHFCFLMVVNLLIFLLFVGAHVLMIEVFMELIFCVGSTFGLDSMGDGHHDNTQGRDSKDDGGGRGGAATTKPHMIWR